MSNQYACLTCGHIYNANNHVKCPKCKAIYVAPQLTSISSAEKTATRNDASGGNSVVSTSKAKKIESFTMARVAQQQSKVVSNYAAGIQILGLILGIAVAALGLFQGTSTQVKIEFILVGIFIAFAIYVQAALTRMFAAYINFKSHLHLESNEIS